MVRTPKEAADELTPIDDLYAVNEALRAENERLTLDNQRLTEMWDTDRESLTAEIERLRTDLDMVAEERDAWKARALGLPQAPCRHADHPSSPGQWADLQSETEALDGDQVV